MSDEKIEVGVPGQWQPEGLARLDRKIRETVEHHAETKAGAQTLRWYFLDAALTDPVPRELEDIEQTLQAAELSIWGKINKKERTKKGHLDDHEIGALLKYETDYPVRNRLWRRFREQVFERVGLEFGPPPSGERPETFDVGSVESWRYDVMRALDLELTQLTAHHAHTEVGAATLRWHIWNELTVAPRPVALDEIEQQLEDAEGSLIARFGNEFRRAKGHLHDDMIARMLGFTTPRPIDEGYYRILREKVYGRIAYGFGAVDLPEYSRNPAAIDIGRQGEWNVEGLREANRELAALARGGAKTEAGAQALRWYLLDRYTRDPEPIDLTLVSQRLRNLAASVLSLFDAITGKRQRYLSDSRIARFVGADDEDELEAFSRRAEKRVRERVEVFAED